MADLPFDTLERTFMLLTTGPRPLALPGSVLGPPLPPRAIPLDELRGRLLHPGTPYATRDAALMTLVRLSQQRGGSWTVGLAGVLLPGLRRALTPLRTALPDRTGDFQAEMLAGLLEALATADASRERLASRLTWAAARRGRRLLDAELAEQARRHTGYGPGGAAHAVGTPGPRARPRRR
jgi:hypothetical protein